MYRVKNLLYKFWNSEGRKVFHTFWQAAGGQLISSLLLVRSTADVKVAVGVAVGAGLAALKAVYVARSVAQVAQK